MVGALREAVGPDIDIMVDFHGRPASVNAAMDYLRAIEPARSSLAHGYRFNGPKPTATPITRPTPSVPNGATSANGA